MASMGAQVDVRGIQSVLLDGEGRFRPIHKLYGSNIRNQELAHFATNDADFDGGPCARACRTFPDWVVWRMSSQGASRAQGVSGARR